MPTPIQLPPTQPDVAKQVAPPVGSQLDSVLLRFYATSKNVPIAAQEIDAQSGEPITFHWNLDGINLDKAGVKDVVFLTCGNQVFPAQSVSRIVFDGGFAGIYYHSKYGHDIENWALFEPFQIMVQEPEFIRPDDPDLQRALARQSLKFKQ